MNAPLEHHSYTTFATQFADVDYRAGFDGFVEDPEADYDSDEDEYGFIESSAEDDPGEIEQKITVLEGSSQVDDRPVLGVSFTFEAIEPKATGESDQGDAEHEASGAKTSGECDKRFVMVPRSLLDGRCTATELLVWTCLRSWDSGNGAWPSVVSVGKRAGLSVRTVHYAMQGLRNKGLIISHKRHRHTTIHKLMAPVIRQAGTVTRMVEAHTLRADFVKVPFWLIEDRQRTVNELLVWVCLRCFDRGEGAWPTRKTLERMSGISSQQIKRTLKGLRRRGFIDSLWRGPKPRAHITKRPFERLDKRASLTQTDSYNPLSAKYDPSFDRGGHIGEQVGEKNDQNGLCLQNMTTLGGSNIADHLDLTLTRFNSCTATIASGSSDCAPVLRKNKTAVSNEKPLENETLEALRVTGWPDFNQKAWEALLAKQPPEYIRYAILATYNRIYSLAHSAPPETLKNPYAHTYAIAHSFECVDVGPEGFQSWNTLKRTQLEYPGLAIYELYKWFLTLTVPDDNGGLTQVDGSIKIFLRYLENGCLRDCIESCDGPPGVRLECWDKQVVVESPEMAAVRENERQQRKLMRRPKRESDMWPT